AQVRVAGPDLGPVDLVAAGDPLRPRADGGEIGTGVRFTHTDGERQLTTRDPGQEALALLFRSEAQEQRTALPIGDPLRGDGRAGGQHLFQHDVPFERGSFVAPVLLGPGQADPSAGAHLLTELAIEAAPRASALVRGVAGERGPQERAYFGS